MFTFAIQTLIANRCRELGLGHGELVRRCGYKSVSKGIRRLAQLCAGDVHKGQTLLRVLPIALEVTPDVVNRAVAETKQQVDDANARAAAEKEAAWRAAFRPHTIILTERRRPEPIFIAGFIGVDRLLRVDFDLSAGRATYLNQALNGVRVKLREWNSNAIPAFGCRRQPLEASSFHIPASGTWPPEDFGPSSMAGWSRPHRRYRFSGVRSSRNLKRIQEATLGLAGPFSHHNRGGALSWYPWVGTTLSNRPEHCH